MPFEKGQHYQLKRPFWGHQAGKRGRISSVHQPDSVNKWSAKLKLRGSPLASVGDHDVGDLIEPVESLPMKAIEILDALMDPSSPFDAERVRGEIRKELKSRRNRTDYETAKELVLRRLAGEDDPTPGEPAPRPKAMLMMAQPTTV